MKLKHCVLVAAFLAHPTAADGPRLLHHLYAIARYHGRGQRRSTG